MARLASVAQPRKVKKMKKNKKIEHICLGILVGAAFISVAVMIILTVTPVKRTSKATTYDLECVAGRSRNPLQSCKESK